MDNLDPDEEFGSDELKNIKDALENQDLTSAVVNIKDYFKQLDNGPLNIAVTGETGSGKSTFINVFRGLGHEEADSAPTGVVEITSEPKEYFHPKYPNVTLWDLPGCSGIGTPTFKSDQYLKAVKFERFDFFFIVAADRFRECHVQLASEIQKMKKNFYFLRNKIDANIAAEKRSKPRTFNEEKTLDTIRRDCIKGLQKFDVAALYYSSDVFLISCFDLGLFDFNRLLDTIENELPKHKRHVLLLALPNITMEILQKKKNALQADVWMVAFLAAVPVTGLTSPADAKLLLLEIEKYQKAFNLDDESLQKLAETSDVPVEELKAEMKNTIEFNEEGVKQRLTGNTKLAVVERAAALLLRLIPVMGPLLAGGLSFASTHYMLKTCLDELAKDAHNVLMKAVSTAERKMLAVSVKKKLS